MKMTRSKQLVIAYALICILASVLIWLGLPWKGVQAQDDEHKTVTAKGINFNVPEDWPIEERGGTVGPIPIEEYLGLKFRKIQQQFADIDAERGTLEKDVESLKEQTAELKKLVLDVDARLSDLEQWLKYGNARRL